MGANCVKLRNKSNTHRSLHLDKPQTGSLSNDVVLSAVNAEHGDEDDQNNKKPKNEIVNVVLKQEVHIGTKGSLGDPRNENHNKPVESHLLETSDINNVVSKIHIKAVTDSSNGHVRTRKTSENYTSSKDVHEASLRLKETDFVPAAGSMLYSLEIDAEETSNAEDSSNDTEIEVHPDTTYPHEVWQEYLQREVGQVENVTPVDPKSEIGTKCIRFVCMSDTHGFVENTDFAERVPFGDVLLHAGDFTMNGTVDEFEDFNNFLGRLPHRIKLVIPGNHEVTLDPRAYEVDERTLRRRLGLPMNPPEDNPTEHITHMKALLSNARVLIDNLVELCGIKIYGVPWVPIYGVSGFGLCRGFELLQKYNKIPAGIDVLMSHGPALGFCDLTLRGKHAGCVELHNSVRKRIRPKYFISGHIHEGHGMQTDGSTIYINAAVCSKGYRPVQEPIVFDFPLPQPYTRDDFLKLSPGDLILS